MNYKRAVLISCFDWYEARLKPIQEHLSRADYEVTILLSDFEHIKLSYVTKKHPECTYIHVTSYNKNISINRIRSHLMFGRNVNRWIKSHKPDLIYIQIPPNNTAYFCLNYKKRFPQTKLILDIIDLWPESMPIGKFKNSFLVYIWKKWRNDAINVADHVFTECKLYQSKLKISGPRISALYLFKEQTREEVCNIQDIISRRDNKEKTIRFAYLGSMNNIIDIEGICSVIKQFIRQGYKCELHAIGDGESKYRFKNKVEEIDCKAIFYGQIFDENEKIKILAPCDFAFNMMVGSVSVGLTIKSIDYLSYGLPLINNIDGDTWNLVKNNEIGINIEKNREIKFPINKFDHAAIRDLFIEQFSRTSFDRNLGDGLKDIEYRDIGVRTY